MIGKEPKWKGLINVALEMDTHAEFLNEVFGTNYKKWMSGTWDYSNTLSVWMVRFYGRTGDWENRFVTKDKIVEKYLGSAGVWKGKVIDGLDRPCRIVVAVDDRGYYRTYTIKGVFLLNQKESKMYYRVFDRIE